MLASQLGPLLHIDHPCRRPFSLLTRRALTAPRTTPPTRRRGVSFQAAEGGSVFTPAPTRANDVAVHSCYRSERRRRSSASSADVADRNPNGSDAASVRPA
jgi:hypothetical protein